MNQQIILALLDQEAELTLYCNSLVSVLSISV